MYYMIMVMPSGLHTRSRRLPPLLLSLRLIATSLLFFGSTGTAQYVELTTYTDTACEVLDNTLIMDGTVDILTGADVIGQCYNRTTYFEQYECADSKLMSNKYGNDSTCSSAATTTTQFSADGCAGRATYTCTDNEPEWSFLTNWTVDTAYYSNADCTTREGSATSYTMEQYMLNQQTESCRRTELGGAEIDLNFATRCVDGNLASVGYNASDTTCSLTVVIAQIEASRCKASGLDDKGAYVLTSCTDLNDISAAARIRSAIVAAAMAAAMAAMVGLHLFS